MGISQDVNKSFINCIEALYNIDNSNKTIDELILDKKIFKPSLFCSLNNGNLIEIFRSEEVEEDGEYNKWLSDFKDDLKKLKIKDDFILKNLYSSFTNFIKYHFEDNKKNYEFYQDLLGRKDFLFKEDLNIFIIEKTSYDSNSELNLVCPKVNIFADYFNEDNNTIILLNTGNYFEPIICLRFVEFNVEPTKKLKPCLPIYKFNYNKTKFKDGNDEKNAFYKPIIKTLFNIAKEKCNETKIDLSNQIFDNNLENLSYFINNVDLTISKYIYGNNLKIQGLVFTNDIYLPIFPSGIQEPFDKLDNMDYVLKNLISFQKYEKEIDLLIKDNSFFTSYKINELISETKDGDKVLKGALLKNGTVIPLKNEQLSIETKSLDYEDMYDFNIDNNIYKKKEVDNKRIKFNYDYNNENYQFQKIRYIFNDFIRNIKNEKDRQLLKKIVVNPVYKLNAKRQKSREIVEKIFNELFHFGNLKERPDIFKNKTKKLVKCYSQTKKKCKDDCEYINNKCKSFITKINIVTGEENYPKYINQIVEEIVRDSKKGLQFITKKIDNITEIDFSNKKNEIFFSDEQFEYLESDLYKKKKVRHVRNINIFDTVNQKNSIKITKDEWQKLKEGGKKKNIKRNSVEESLSKSLQKSLSVNNIEGTETDIFGEKRKKKKIKKGKCIFPYKLKREGGYKIMNDCYPELPGKVTPSGTYGADGAYCPTKVDSIYNKHKLEGAKHKFWKKEKVKGKDVKFYNFDVETNDEKPKGFCNFRDYILRQKTRKLKDKKINPNCKKTFKLKKDKDYVPTNYTENGEEYTIVLEKDKNKIKDKFEPYFVCPVEVDDKDVFDHRVHKTEKSFI